MARRGACNICHLPPFPNLQFYVDDGYTGANFNRSDFQQLLSDVEDGKVGIIVTKDLSRLGCNQLHT